ncbi:MAG: Methyl-accepting chemotaxis protein PctA [Planctomycetota bacterium]|jgi:hypothetical protein
MPAPRPSIATHAACFLFVGLAPLCTALFMIDDGVDDGSERAAIASMAAIAEAKAARLDALARERLRNAAAAATDAALAGDAATARARAEAFITACEIERLLLLDAEGRVTVDTKGEIASGSSASEARPTTFGIDRALDAVRRDRSPRLTPPSIARDGVRPTVDAVGPILDDGKLVGFTVIPIPNDSLDAIVGDYTGLGRTGDAIGIVMVGNQVVATTPSRANAALAATALVARGDPELRRHQELLYGSPFRGRSPDTQGVDAVGAWVRVPALAWGVVVTQQASEVFEASEARALMRTRALANSSVVALLAAALATFVVTLLVRRGRAPAAAARTDS